MSPTPQDASPEQWRGLPPIDPREREPNDNGAGPNDPPVSVGPTSSEGFGNSHVMFPGPPVDAPPQVGAGLWNPDWAMPVPEAWSGWPDGWQTPMWGDSSDPWGSGTSRIDPKRLLDIVFACIDLNARVLSTMPPYTHQSGGPADNPSWITDPEPLVYPGKWPEMFKELVWCLYACGEVFLYATTRFADSSGGYPARFMVLDPTLVHMQRDGSRVRYALGESFDSGVEITDDVLHLKYLSVPGALHGRGPLDAAGLKRLQILALNRYATGLAGRGGIPWAVIKYPGRLADKQRAQLQQQWVRARASAMGAPAVMSDGAELEVLSTTPRDMALTDMQGSAEVRLAVLLGVPPFMVGLQTGDSNTYSNVTSLFDWHWRASLRPVANSILPGMSAWLLPRGTDIEVDRDEYVRPGLLERAQAYEVLVRIGVLDPQEIRAMERFGSRFGV